MVDDTVNGLARDDSNHSLDRVLTEVDTLLRSNGVLDAFTSKESDYETLLEEIGAKIDEEMKKTLDEGFFTEIGAISSGLAHDLRGPLQTIRNSTYLLVSEPNQGELLDDINGAVRHLSTMLDQFREYYRGHEIRKTSARLDKTIDAALHDLIIPPGIELVKTLDPRIERVRVDRNKLAKVIHNLAESAINVMPGGGRVTIETLKRGDRFSVIVSDTGTGVIEATPETLFTPFEYKERDETGLSLPIARRVVRAHGGDIVFEADPETGTTCTLELPIGL